MIKLKEIIREVINEELTLESQASDDAKRQGLEYMSFGRWGKGGKITHTTQGGKLVPVTGADGKVDRKLAFPARVYKSPETQRDIPVRKSITGPDRDKLAVRQDTQTWGGRQRKFDAIASELDDKLANAIESGKLEYNKDYSSFDFMNKTGLKPSEFKFLSLYNDKYAGYEATFSYDEDTDEVFVHDPADI